MHLLKIMLKASGGRGVPQGGVVSPLLSNIYLTEVDRMLERAKEATRYGKYTGIEYARFADDLVILIDAHPRHDWLLPAVEKRLREELVALQVEINEEKSRIVDLSRGESFGFLGFDFRRIRSRRGVWRVQYTPKLKKRTALLRKLKDVFRRYQSQPVGRVVQLINPVLRGWVNYFAVGHSSECFSLIKNWVEKKVRRHLMRARKRKGFGWKRWSRQWLYENLKLFNSYRVRRPPTKVALVVHHSGFDVLIPSHSRMGKFSGGKRISMLRGTPGWRRMKPFRSRVTIIWWTDGGLTRKWRWMSASAGGCPNM